MSVGSGPMSCPPNLKTEYTHEPDSFEFAKWNHVVVFGFGGVETNEATMLQRGIVVGVFVGFGIMEKRGRGGGCYVGWDLSEKRVAICKKT